MAIKMPIKFHGSYSVIIRSEGAAKRERCQKLNIRELAEAELPPSSGDSGDSERPTHKITFYDFGCKRILDGKLMENEVDKAVFKVQDKEYEFAPFRPSR